jgi:hypothetical protein
VKPLAFRRSLQEARSAGGLGQLRSAPRTRRLGRLQSAGALANPSPSGEGRRLVEVRSGLVPGEEVVTAGADGLADGTTVRVTRDLDPYTGASTVAGALPRAETKPSAGQTLKHN